MANKVDTTEELKAQMKRNGVRLPHGYTVVKRKSTKKKSSMAKKSTTGGKKVTKQTAAQKQFAANAKRAGQLVKSGKAKNTKAAWKIIKSSL